MAAAYSNKYEDKGARRADAQKQLASPPCSGQHISVARRELLRPPLRARRRLPRSEVATWSMLMTSTHVSHSSAFTEIPQVIILRCHNTASFAGPAPQNTSSSTFSAHLRHAITLFQTRSFFVSVLSQSLHLVLYFYSSSSRAISNDTCNLCYDQEYVCLSNRQTAFREVVLLSNAVPSGFCSLSVAVMV